MFFYFDVWLGTVLLPLFCTYVSTHIKSRSTVFWQDNIKKLLFFQKTCQWIFKHYNSSIKLIKSQKISKKERKKGEGLAHATVGMGQFWSLQQLSTSNHLIDALCIVCVLFYQVILELTITNIFKWTLENEKGIRKASNENWKLHCSTNKIHIYCVVL